MHKIVSWFFIVMFIILVPLGVFFDIKQPPKPNNMEQFFMKREKRSYKHQSMWWKLWIRVFQDW